MSPASSSGPFPATPVPDSGSRSPKNQRSSRSLEDLVSFLMRGHLRYYGVVCKKKEKVKSKDCDETMTLKKKRMKMIKGLSKDLSAPTHMRFAGEEDLMEEQFRGEDDLGSRRGSAGTAASALKAEEKEMKRRKKEKAAMKAAQMKAMGDCNNSSSSSSESSNSECGEVVDMSCLRSGALAQDKIGVVGAVVGCKCMGKCRDGPNVRVRL